MLEAYTNEIFNIFALKENSNLTSEQKRTKVTEILYIVKCETETSYKDRMKKKYIKAIETTIKNIP